MSRTDFNILMIEDMERYHRMFAAEIHDGLGAQVDFAVSGEDGLDILHKDPLKYDLLILDLTLPGLSGEEVLREIRRDHRFDNLIVVVLTGQTSSKVESTLLSAGANDFIEKGCAPELFVARLRAQVRNKNILDRLTQLAVDRELFAAGVLHDLRNIEANLLATCELIEMALRSDPVKNLNRCLEDVDNLKAQVQRMDEYASNIIGQVRDSGKSTPPMPIALQPLIEWIEHFLAAGSKNAPIQIDVAKNMGAVLAEESLLRLALLNIIQNSIKYARPGVPPQVRIEEVPADKNKVLIKITDNGTGVSEANLRKIFQPFFRGEKTSGEKKGFGLGLSMVTKVIYSMNGRVWAERPSHQEFGLCICVELPRAL